MIGPMTSRGFAILIAAVLTLAGCSAAPSTPPAPASNLTQPIKAVPATAKTPSPMHWIHENYPGVNWYRHIKSARQVGAATWVNTDLRSTQAEDGAAICSAVIAWQRDRFHEFRGVTVRSATGSRLAWAINEGDTC